MQFFNHQITLDYWIKYDNLAGPDNLTVKTLSHRETILFIPNKIIFQLVFMRSNIKFFIRNYNTFHSFLWLRKKKKKSKQLKEKMSVAPKHKLKKFQWQNPFLFVFKRTRCHQPRVYIQVMFVSWVLTTVQIFLLRCFLLTKIWILV